jgi:hypothetical protein
MEVGEVALKASRSVPCRIHRDEENLDAATVLVHHAEGLGELREGEGADVRTGGVPEEDHEDFPPEISG